MTYNLGATVSGPYVTDGVQTVFGFGFKIYATTDLEVVYTNSLGAESIVPPANWTVSATDLGKDLGGNVTIPVPPVTGGKITCRLNPRKEQQTNLRNQGAYSPEAVERMADRLEMQILSVAEEAGRAVKVSVSSGIDPEDYLSLAQTAAAEAEAAQAATEIKAAEAAASAATIGGFNVSGASAANDTLLWDTGVSKFIRKTLAQLKTALAVPTLPSGVVQNNFSSGTNPTTANDNTQGYALGSLWINTSTARTYHCYSAATGAAVWGEIIQAGGSQTLASKTLDRPTITGRTDAGSAAAGNVGEYVSAKVLTGAAVALTNGIAANVTSISLTAGEYDVTGLIVFKPAATTTIVSRVSSISLTSNTHRAAGEVGHVGLIGTNTGIVGANDSGVPTGTCRVSISATTTVYLVAAATFGTSTLNAYGEIVARRIQA